MTLCTSQSVGGYVASEAATIAFGRLYKQNATKRPVIFVGSGGDSRELLGAIVGGQIVTRLADVGVPFIGAEMGGGLLWGNDTVQARIGQAWTYVKAQMGTKTDKFIGIGASKGATALLNYMRNNPGNVAAFVGLIPAVNVSDIYDNSRPLTSQAEINAAYPSGGWAGNKATHDPALNTATHASQAIPTKLIYGDSDTTVIPSTVTAFASAVGSSVQLQAVSGGTHLTTCAVVDPIEDFLKFVAPYV